MEISYTIEVPGETHFEYHFKIGVDGCDQKAETNDYPEWAKLEVNQCPHCSLSPTDTTYCPIAANISTVIEDCNQLISHRHVNLTVKNEQRTIISETTAQKALCSLLGLIMATSPCPHTLFFRPMAYYHLPVASEQETIFRAISTFLLHAYFSSEVKSKIEIDFSKLVSIYRDMQIVNEYLIQRIRPYMEGDASANAVVLLHMLSCTLPMTLEEFLEKIHTLFNPCIRKTTGS